MKKIYIILLILIGSISFGINYNEGRKHTYLGLLVHGASIGIDGGATYENNFYWGIHGGAYLGGSDAQYNYSCPHSSFYNVAKDVKVTATLSLNLGYEFEVGNGSILPYVGINGVRNSIFYTGVSTVTGWTYNHGADEKWEMGMIWGVMIKPAPKGIYINLGMNSQSFLFAVGNNLFEVGSNKP